MAARTGSSASSSEEAETPKEEAQAKAPETPEQEQPSQEELEQASLVPNPELPVSEGPAEPQELPAGWTPDSGTIPGDLTVGNYVVAEEGEEVPESKES